MKAIVQHQYGSADVLALQEVDKPEIGDDDVLVRVQAAGGVIGGSEPWVVRCERSWCRRS